MKKKNGFKKDFPALPVDEKIVDEKIVDEKICQFFS